MAVALLGCSPDSKNTRPDDPLNPSTTATDDTGAPATASGDDTDATTDTVDTASSPDLPVNIEAPETVLPADLSACTLITPPTFEVRYVGASPHMASVPIVVVDGASVAAGGFCLEQTFSGGGQLTRCGRTDIQGASAYLQGAPAPGQTVSLRLGAIVNDELCWAPEEHPTALGEVSAPGFAYEPLGTPLSTPDYPPAAIGMVNTGDSFLYAMALLDSPAFGVHAGDVLWSFDSASYGSGIITEVNRLTNGLFSFNLEHDATDYTHHIFEPTYPGRTALTLDAAGFEWLKSGDCADADDASCMGFVHHGNATIPGSDVTLTMSYERLYDDDGEPYFYPGQEPYYLVGASFQGHTSDHHGVLERAFELSFHELFELDPDLCEAHGQRSYFGPGNETSRSAYYVNSTDVVQDVDDPALYHLTGTLTIAPYNGFYHLILTADGEVVEKTLYNNLNEDLTWDHPLNISPLNTLGHNAEFMGYDGRGAEHFLVYDRSASVLPTTSPKCSAFYHIVNRGGEMTVGGPYHNRVVTEEDGDICGNSMSYGNASTLSDVRLDNYNAPVQLIASFDNVALPSDQGSAWSNLETTYAAGTPRLLGLYLSEDGFNPDGWRSVATFLGRNIEGNDPVGFNSLVTHWPTLLVADSPFLLHGL